MYVRSMDANVWTRQPLNNLEIGDIFFLLHATDQKIYMFDGWKDDQKNMYAIDIKSNDKVVLRCGTVQGVGIFKKYSIK